MAKAKSALKPVEELSYEEAFAELEGIIETLEREENSLDDSMKLYERGQALTARCGILLEEAQLKVKKLAGDALVDFEESSE